MSEDLGEFLVKLRDGAQMIADAARKQLEDMAPSEIKETWDPTRINWVSSTGPKGPFEIAEDQENPEFKLMLKDLLDHDGKLTKDNIFYWSFKNDTVVGRKPKNRLGAIFNETEETEGKQC